MKCYIFCSTDSSNTTDLTHTGTHAYTHVRTCVHTPTHTQRLRHVSQKRFMCTTPTNILTSNDRQKQTASPHCRPRYEGIATAQPRLHTSTHPTHSHTFVHAHICMHKRTQHWLGHMPTGHPWSKAT